MAQLHLTAAGPLVVPSLWGPPKHEDSCICERCIDEAVDKSLKESSVVSSAPPPKSWQPVDEPRTFYQRLAELETKLHVQRGPEGGCYFCAHPRRGTIGKLRSTDQAICHDCGLIHLAPR